MYIDVDRLREDLERNCRGAFWGGGFGGALMESFDVEQADADELVEIARRQGIDLEEYEI